MTDFETYIINLKKDKHKFDDVQNKLNKVNIIPHRFDAIYGKTITDFGEYTDFVSHYCKYFCAKGVIGCGLSHFILLNNIHKGVLKGNENKFTLILEDDVIPLFKNKKEINDIIDNIPNDCDILLLYCFGTCPYNPLYDNARVVLTEHILSLSEMESNPYVSTTSENAINTSWLYKKPFSKYIGSTAAYLIRNNAIPKILKHKLYTHVDMQMYNTLYDTLYVYYKPLFYTDDSSSDVNETNHKKLEQLNYHFPLPVHNTNTARILTYPIFRFPLIDVTINSLNLIQIIVLFMVILCIYYVLSDIIIRQN